MTGVDDIFIMIMSFFIVQCVTGVPEVFFQYI